MSEDSASTENQDSAPDSESGGANNRNEAPKLASPPDLLTATADLCARLQAISTAPRPSAIAAELAERWRYIQMLRELSAFLKRVWLDRGRIQAGKQIYELCAALDQLEKGVAHPVFQPAATGKGGVKPDRFDIWDGRKWVCLAVECYIKAGETKSDAVAIMARKNRDLKVLMRAGGKERHGLPGAILSWHRAFRDGTANKLAQSRWEEALQLVIELPVASAEGWLDRARICLTKANEAATTMIATESRTKRRD